MNVMQIYIKNKRFQYIPIKTYVANTQSLRSTGLSTTMYLPPLTGMLFVMPTIMPVNVTMRKTSLYLDIIFIDENDTVCGIKSGMPYAQEFVHSDYPVRYFLEVPMLTCQENLIDVGSKVYFNIN